jgi:pimeloyl-ACP methyl ester carboxylesterase/DNA-binding winged helix-turn-helix (wHTH) protein
VSTLLDGRLELDETLFELRGADGRVPLEPQAFDVLIHLVRHRDRLVSKEELMDAIWGGRFVSETAVTSRIKQVRRALGDDGSAQRLVKTVHGRGYRYIGLVADVPGSADTDREKLDTQPPPHRAGLPPEAEAPVSYTLSDDLHIAYQVTGAGDTDIVLISGFVSHLEQDWEEPRHALFLQRLGSMGRLIRFDKRGTGMSDRPSGIPDLETRMHDVLAVMDAAGSRSAVVVGYSEGGPMAILLAAMHPSRVSALVLYGSYARRTWAPDYPYAQTAAERAVYTEALVSGWDWEADMRRRNPTADVAMQRWWARRMRAGATPGTVRALMNMNDSVDVREVLPSVRVPTLVLHRRDDALFSADEAVYLAERIPGAELRILDGADHFVAGDPEQLIAEIVPFMASHGKVQERTSLTAVAVPVGEAAEEVTERLVAAGGRRRVTGHGTTALLFDGPATAVRASYAAVIGRHSRVGISIAEVAVEGLAAHGPGVDLAVTLAQRAEPGQVWTSAAVGLLLPASGIELAATDDPSTYVVESV